MVAAASKWSFTVEPTPQVVGARRLVATWPGYEPVVLAETWPRGDEFELIDHVPPVFGSVAQVADGCLRETGAGRIRDEEAPWR